MYPVSVGAGRRRVDGDGVDDDVPTAVKSEVKLRTVPDIQPLNGQVPALKEPDRLRTKESLSSEGLSLSNLSSRLSHHRAVARPRKR